ncbi:MAG: glycoside hydrolase family 25 protein [Prevotella sp.]|nr:glycoside hydrolase family 25 protein [Prevotella sp.]MCI2080060.1 glycoside hydrolase family 25 protein [Prevotella sp.]MCI2101827.1 glycoside hydrolase family 25 protein [Prevotella sp.]
MGNRRTTTRKRIAANRKITTRRTTSRSRSFVPRFLRKYPRWAWWAGGIGIVVFYIWVFYYFFVGPTGFRWRALYGDANYPEGYEIHGIDISHYQGNIDWDALQNAMIENCPVRFIIIKSTEGSSKLDENFNDNFYQAREYGFIRGAYHFWSTKSSARDQAYYFLKQVHLEDGDLPPVLDIEHKPKDQSVEDFQMDVLTWLHIVEDKYHVKPIIYTYYKFKDAYLNAPVFDDYPYWIAHYYVDKVEYKGKWKFWQHTDAGRLPGIKGYVDFNIYNGSYYDLRRLTIGSDRQVGTDAYDE